MATATENVNARSNKSNLTSGRSVDREYMVLDAADEDDAESALLALIPATVNWGGQDLILTEISLKETERAGDYQCAAHWEPKELEQSKPKPPSETNDEIRVEIGPEGSPIKRAVNQNTILRAGVPVGAVDNGGLVGWNEGGFFHGAPDTPVGVRINFSRALPLASVTAAYVKTLAQLQGTTNNAAFKGYAAGELFFEQVTLDKLNTEAGDYEASFDFIVGKPGVNVNLAGIANVNWNPHEFVELIWRQEFDPANPNAKPKWVAIAAVVSKIFDDADWTGLGIGT